MKNPLISVIVPIYNVEKYLATCIKSIQNQTLADIEIILVDDGTPDSSGLIADEFSKSDERIKVIHKTNGGLSSARNSGLQLAAGEYISFIDSDDWIEPTMLEDMYSSALKIDADIVVSGVIVEYPLEKRRVINNIKDNLFISTPSEIGNLYWHLHKSRLSNYAWNKIYKNAFIKENEFKFVEDAMPAEDLFFNLSLFSESKFITVLNKAYYHYIRRDETTILTNFHKNLTQIESRRKTEYEDFFKHFKMNEKEHSTFLNRLKVGSASAIVINLFKANAPHGRKIRIETISENIFNNRELADKISKYIPYNTYEKIFVLLYRYTNSYIMEMSYSILFFLRRKFVRIYLKFRKNELI